MKGVKKVMVRNVHWKLIMRNQEQKKQLDNCNLP